MEFDKEPLHSEKKLITTLASFLVLAIILCLPVWGASTIKQVKTPTVYQVGSTAAALPRIDPLNPKLPPIKVVAYGYDDSLREKWTAAGVFDSYTIIAGTTTDAQFVKDLRAKGILFAYLVPPTSSATSAPFKNTLNGQLPGGFDAIAVDEFNCDAQGESMVDLVKKIKTKYPKKVFIGYGNARRDSSCKPNSLLKALGDYIDLYILERYVDEREGKSFDFSSIYAGMLNKVKLGDNDYKLRNKTILAIGTSNREWDPMDNDSDVDFKDYLEIQFRALNNQGGIAFWPTYGLSDDNLLWVSKLAKNYFLDNIDSRMGNSSFVKGLVQNPSFEKLSSNKPSSWQISVGTGGSVAAPTYAEAKVTYPKPVYSGTPQRVPEGSRGLFMKRGSTPNTVSQTISLKAGKPYFLVAYAKNLNGNTDTVKGEIKITSPNDGSNLVVKSKIRKVNLCKGCSESTTNTFTKFLYEFTAPATGSVKLAITDETATNGYKVFWDFIEVEETHGISPTSPFANVPSPSPTPSPTPTPTATPTATPTPLPSGAATPTPTATPTPIAGILMTVYRYQCVAYPYGEPVPYMSRLYIGDNPPADLSTNPGAPCKRDSAVFGYIYKEAVTGSLPLYEMGCHISSGGNTTYYYTTNLNDQSLFPFCKGSGGFKVQNSGKPIGYVLSAATSNTNPLFSKRNYQRMDIAAYHGDTYYYIINTNDQAEKINDRTYSLFKSVGYLVKSK